MVSVYQFRLLLCFVVLFSAVPVSAQRSDSVIQAEVRASLLSEPALSATEIEVEVIAGTVHLSGVAASVNDKVEAERLAWVSGVRAVDSSKLEVVPELAEQVNSESLEEGTVAPAPVEGLTVTPVP